MITSEHWRIFPEFRDKLAYLDIETTGLEKLNEEITTIALYSNNAIKYYVLGENLNDFREDIFEYSVLVTYNGKLFDIPIIEKKLRIKLNHAHIDLRWVLKSIGAKGGLKKSERHFGIARKELEGIDGTIAPKLWKEYEINKDISALETLIAYNIQDVLNLEKLLVIAYNKKVADTPFSITNRITGPIQPSIPFRANREIVDKIIKKRNW